MHAARRLAAWCLSLAFASTAMGPDRYFNDQEAVSSDGRFLITAKSPDNARSPVPSFQSDFCYTLTDTTTGNTLWSRELTVWAPIRVWVHTDSSVTIWTGNHSFIGLDAVTGDLRTETQLRHLLPREDFDRSHPGRVSQTTAGPMWTRSAHFGFFDHNGGTYFGCRTGWDRVFVLDFANARSITDPPRAITEAFDFSLRAAAMRTLTDAARKPETIRGPRFYEFAPGVCNALDIAGRMDVRDAIPLIRVLEAVEPASEAPLKTIDPGSLDPKAQIRPYRFREEVRTALRRLGEVPRALAVGYVVDDFWGPAKARIPIPPDRAARARDFAGDVTRETLLSALGPPDAMFSRGNDVIWQYEIDEPGTTWVLEASLPQSGDRGSVRHLTDTSLLRQSPAERAGDIF